MKDGAVDAAHPRPLLLTGRRGALAALYYAPRPGTAVRGGVLVAPAFAEEMNRCRSMVSLQARRWATAGLGTLVLDPGGTGDSAGEFVDATWADWRADLLVGADWLAQQGVGCTTLLGIRLGALMALEIARLRHTVQRLVLWQPVLSGKTYYTQFLRIRLAAEMQRGTRATTTGDLRQLSQQGLPVEVSGYEIGPALARELDQLAFLPEGLPATLAVHWFEVAAAGSEQAELAPVTQDAVAKLRAHGLAATTGVVQGPPFWQVHERELAPALIEATEAACRSWTAPTSATAAMAAVPAENNVSAIALEQLVAFDCGADRLVGCLHRDPKASATRGVVVVVAGGPQYRAGAHRQFVNLARHLVAQGLAVLRFDLRGMGDSSGHYQGFEHSAADIKSAVDALLRLQPTLQDVVLVGECESASGILFYAWQDTRVAGAVLVNPWVRSAEGQAQVIVKRYYADRLRSAEFWRKLLSGRFDLVRSARSFVRVWRDYREGRRLFKAAALPSAHDDMAQLPLPVKTAFGLSRFKGRVLLLMSGHDYIAREFDEVTAASTAWTGLLDSPRLVRRDIADADHTFSRREWKDAAVAAITGWIGTW